MLTVVILGSKVMLVPIIRLIETWKVSVPSARTSLVIEMLTDTFGVLWSNSKIMLVVSLKSSGAGMWNVWESIATHLMHISKRELGYLRQILTDYNLITSHACQWLCRDKVILRWILTDKAVQWRIDSHKAEPLMVDTSRVRFVPMLPSNTDTHRVTSPSDSETIYSSISNPMTTSVKSEISNLQHTSLWHCTTVYQLLNSSESIRTITVMIVNTDSCHIGINSIRLGERLEGFYPISEDIINNRNLSILSCKSQHHADLFTGKLMNFQFGEYCPSD